MGSYLIRRVLWMIPTLLAISAVSFLIIQLPPGDFLTTYVASLEAQGGEVSAHEIAVLKQRYGLDQPAHVQYWKWLTGILRGDFGFSFLWNRPVRELIGERMLMTVIISLVTLVVSWLVAIPIGIFTAFRQYSILDYIMTFIGFIGLAVPGFLIALVFMYLAYVFWGVNVTGLFSREYLSAGWSWGKFVDMLHHLWVPVLVVGTSGSASTIRIMRGCLLDELSKPYVETARAKGLPELYLLAKYPVRIAINPLISTIGRVLPSIVSGTVTVSVVLNLETTGPLLLEALRAQDMYLAGSFIFLLSILTVIGTLLSDLLLAWADPRIRYE